MLSCYISGFSHHNFTCCHDSEVLCHWLNGHSHVINNNSFLFWSIVNEACRPSLKCFETEREAVLAGLKSRALMDHSLIFGESISCLEVFHLVVLVTGCVDVLGPVVIGTIILRLTIRNVQVLNQVGRTFDSWSSFGGIRAMGSTGCGRLGSLWGRGRRNYEEFTHLTTS